MKKELTTLRLWNPLFPHIYPRNEWGDLENNPVDLSAGEILEYEDEQMSFCDGMCPECYFNDSCCNYYGPERDASDWRLYNDLKEDEYD